MCEIVLPSPASFYLFFQLFCTDHEVMSASEHVRKPVAYLQMLHTKKASSHLEMPVFCYVHRKRHLRSFSSK